MIATVSEVEKLISTPLTEFYKMQTISQWILVAIIGMILTFVIKEITKHKLNSMWLNLILVILIEALIDVVATIYHNVYWTPMIVLQEILAVIFTAHISQGMYDWVKRLSKKKESSLCK